MTENTQAPVVLRLTKDTHLLKDFLFDLQAFSITQEDIESCEVEVVAQAGFTQDGNPGMRIDLLIGGHLEESGEAEAKNMRAVQQHLCVLYEENKTLFGYKHPFYAKPSLWSYVNNDYPYVMKTNRCFDLSSRPEQLLSKKNRAQFFSEKFKFNASVIKVLSSQQDKTEFIAYRSDPEDFYYTIHGISDNGLECLINTNKATCAVDILLALEECYIGASEKKQTQFHPYYWSDSNPKLIKTTACGQFQFLQLAN